MPDNNQASINVSTHVEMNLLALFRAAFVEQCLHARGDEPIAVPVRSLEVGMSPRTWR